MTTTDNRFARGLNKLLEIHPQAGQEVLEKFKDLCPDLGRMIVEFPFAEIYSRPQLDAKSRQIATIAALITLGNSPWELKAHIQGGLNVGLTQTEIIEVILQMAVYAGFPAAVNAMTVAKEVFLSSSQK